MLSSIRSSLKPNTELLPGGTPPDPQGPLRSRLGLAFSSFYSLKPEAHLLLHQGKRVGSGSRERLFDRQCFVTPTLEKAIPLILREAELGGLGLAPVKNAYLEFSRNRYQTVRQDTDKVLPYCWFQENCFLRGATGSRAGPSKESPSRILQELVSQGLRQDTDKTLPCYWFQENCFL
ncbi:hypothetical protein TRICI_004587 [Trichomonascus ciferrii]|uniref:Uncharacterized protein n=1 Tax=Trichomonascus ciferrii TaxID=44093 RepID=A0A642V0J5_9ASCO|nr:hypothetical protein TRICI_004587 [Trichomonascus ciferrii]